MTLQLQTLLIAAITVRAAFVLIFIANAYKRRRQTYLLLWFASPLFALGALLAVMSLTSFPVMPAAAGAGIGALAGISFSLRWSGVRALLKRPQGLRRTVLQGLAPGLVYGVFAAEGALAAAWVAMLGSLSLLAAMPLVDLAPVYRRSRSASQFFVLAGQGYYGLAFASAAVCIALGAPMGGSVERILLIAFAADPFFVVLLLVNFLAITGEQARQSLREMATHDKLTGLLNRRGFIEATDKALLHRAGRASEACVLLADIDHFKAINDRFGHDAGDVVLAEFGRRCQALFQHPGELAARWGGEEYVVYLPDTSMHEAKRWAEKLRRVVEAEPFIVLGISLDITVSVGAAALMDGEVGIKASLSRADLALYEAKNDGRNCVRLAWAMASPPLQPANDREPAGLQVG